MITISDVIEYLFCPRFTFFMHVLSIPQHEERRFKVQKGRDIHQARTKTNIAYLRKDLQVRRKSIAVYLSSATLGIVGIVDEVLFLRDGTASPLDYKFAEYDRALFRTNRIQSILYGMLIEEHFEVPVERGFLVYTRSDNRVVELPITGAARDEAKGIVAAVRGIIEQGTYPDPTPYPTRCIDCCYRRICEGAGK
ncbi:MAG: CRISPR-associated protein Cas4 [Methanospirillum sp.]